VFRPDLARRPVEFQLELADAAGENWEDLAHEQRGEKPAALIESTFFQFVAEDSDALFYFIAASDLLEEPERVAQQLADLSSTIVLLRSLSPHSADLRLDRPVGLVISKADLLTADQTRILERLLSSGSIRFSRAVDLEDQDYATMRASRSTDYKAHGDQYMDRIDPFFESIDILEELLAILDRQVRHWRGFVVSSILAPGIRIPAAPSAEPRSRRRDADNLGRRELFGKQVGAPIRWVLSLL
jgi:hypothetical protein